jgi:DNA-binding NtrC family response regulator
MGLDPQKLPIYSPITTEVEIKSMGAMFASGHYSCGSYFQSIDTPVNRRFVQEFRTLYGKDEVVSFVMVNTYIGVYLLLTSISTMKTTQPRKILDSLRGKEFQSPGGTIKVNSSNFHLSREVRIGRATANGQFTIVWDSGKSIPAKPFLNKSPDNAASVSESGDLKAIIETWGENTKDAILILSETNRVLYANTKATNWLGIHENDYMAPGQIEQMNGTCSIIQQVIGFKDAYRLILIREKKNNPISKRQPDRQFTYHFHLIKTKNPTYQKQLKIAEVAAQTDSNVLIYGETGCGKEILARSIHEQSHRRENPFIAINAGAMPRELVNSELFGYVHGAFTGAKKGGAIGKFEAANHGTLFLDEIGEMPLDLQVTLLRVIEEKKVTRIGDFVERDLDVRIIAATNRNLKEEIAYKGSFRSDLYYRLNVLSIYIPPLRERKEDLEHLAVEFLRQFHQHYNKGPLTLASDTLAMLMNYHWPGNIRELRNVLERSFLLAIDKKTLNFDYLPDELLYQQHPSPKTDSTLVELEKQMITRIIQETQNMSQAAKRLGIARSTLYRKVKQWKIDI